MLVQQKYIDDFTTDDVLGQEDHENSEILKSIEFAENQLHSKMNTPSVVKQESWKPVSYDVEGQSL